MNKNSTNQNIEDGLPLIFRTYDYEGIAKRLKNMERHDDIIKQLRRIVIEEPFGSRTLEQDAALHFQRILDEYDKLNKTASKYKSHFDEDFWKTHEDPVKHVRENKPTFIAPQNIPDMDIIDKELKSSSRTKDPLTKEEAEELMNAAIYDIHDIDPKIKEKDDEYQDKEIERWKKSPYVLIDYWGRHVECYEDEKEAIDNAENNMYIQSVRYVVPQSEKEITLWKKPEEKEKPKIQAADEEGTEKEMFFLTAKICLLDNLEERREAVKELQELGATNSQIKEMKEWFEKEIIPDLKSKEEAVKELKERYGKKTIFNNLTIENLVKLANLLDEEGFHSIANIIDESAKKIIDIKPTPQVEVIADRCVDEIGRLLKEKKDINPKIRKRLVNIILSLESLKADLDSESLLGIANVLDSIGLVKVADDVDKLIVLAKAELKPPKKWWAKMKAELKEKNPNYNYKRIGEIIRNIWNTQIDEKKKREICKEYKK